MEVMYNKLTLTNFS